MASYWGVNLNVGGKGYLYIDVFNNNFGFVLLSHIEYEFGY